jgi:N-methylhydantoinase A
MDGRARIGVDVGGTFTDAVLVDPGGRITVAKTLTTPADVSRGTLAAVTDLAPVRSVDGIVHGTTLVTNALIERKTAPVGLLVTAGFRDTLEIRRTRRAHLYDLHWTKPPALVRRRFRREVRERIDRNGEIIVPLDEDDVLVNAEFLRASGIRDVAICFLFAFRNDAHERRAAEIVRAVIPDARVSLSSEVIPELREYERCSTTVLNAMATTAMEGYLRTIETELAANDFGGAFHMIKADGGVGTTEYLLRRSIEAYNSGPAAGVAAAAALGRRLGIPNLITLDMGGTSTDVSLIWGGEPLRTMEEELEFGIPIRVPMVDVRSIGAGGGSIAWLDAAGALRVGPQSAGASPGPACYGLGGTEPTVTDANLILGRIDPDYFLGGAMQLDRGAAEEAVAKIADAFGWSLQTAAQAISSIAAANIAQAVREVSIDRGYDPRHFTLLAYGGAGPLYATEVAANLDIPEVVVAVQAGVLSALGCLCADLTHETLRTVLLDATPAAADPVRREWARLEAEAVPWVGDGAEIECSLDMRYVGEAYELTIPYLERPDDERLVEHAVERFHAEHERLYGFRRQDPVEIVNARLRARVPVEGPAWTALAAGAASEAGSGDGQYAFCFRSDLSTQSSRPGPVVVRDAETTTVVHAGQRVRLDELGNLRIAVAGGGRHVS